MFNTLSQWICHPVKSIFVINFYIFIIKTHTHTYRLLSLIIDIEWQLKMSPRCCLSPVVRNMPTLSGKHSCRTRINKRLIDNHASKKHPINIIRHPSLTTTSTGYKSLSNHTGWACRVITAILTVVKTCWKQTIYISYVAKKDRNNYCRRIYVSQDSSVVER